MSIDTIERLEHEIAEEKDALRYNVDELQERARDAVDWRTQVQRHPFAMLGAAALGGLLLAGLLRPSPRLLRSAVAAAGAMAPTAGRMLVRPLGKRIRQALRRRADDRDLPVMKRVVRDARRKASSAASHLADRLSTPTAWEATGERRAKHHPS